MKKKALFLTMLFITLFIFTDISTKPVSALEFPTTASVSYEIPTWEIIAGWLAEITSETNDSSNSVSTVARYTETTSDTEEQTALTAAIEDFEKSIIGTVTNFMFGFAVLSSVLCFIIVVLKFGASGANPNDRNTAIVDLGVCVLCIALLGSVKLITTLIIGITM